MTTLARALQEAKDCVASMGLKTPVLPIIDSVPCDPRLAYACTESTTKVTVIVVGPVAATREWFEESYLPRWPRKYGTRAVRREDDRVVITRSAILLDG